MVIIKQSAIALAGHEWTRSRRRLKAFVFYKKNELKVTDRGDENFNDNDSELLLWHGLFI